MASTKPVPKNFTSRNIVNDELRGLPLTQARRLAVNNELVLKTGIDDLDVMFEQSVREGNIIEWGIPQGKNGRVIPLLFLRHHNVPAGQVFLLQPPASKCLPCPAGSPAQPVFQPIHRPPRSQDESVHQGREKRSVP